MVFMKGCPLRCEWCSNPEGQKLDPEIRFINSMCVGEERCKIPCIQVCAVHAVSLSKEGRPKTDRELCLGCGRCVEVCPYGARQLNGKLMTIEDLLTEILKDEPFYRISRGGVTIGGGEPLMQFEFTRELLKGCKARSVHTVIETCGHVPWEYIEAILEFVDFIYYDIKHMDPVQHKKQTGVSNNLILKNAKRLLITKDAQVAVRVPIVPGFNDSKENIEAITKFVAESGGKMIELLPYHRFGISKYRQLDMVYKMEEVESPTRDHLQRLKRIIESFGLNEVSSTI